MRYLVGIGVFLLGVAMAEDHPERANLIGSWEARAKDESRPVWTLAAAGEKLRITLTENDRKIADVECNTMGKECEVNAEGKPVKVSMWFNGPKLVVMETRGTEVVKRRFHATGDGSAMEVEVIPIVPEGKPELVHLSRAPASR